MALYDHIGSTYDTTRRADPFITQRLHHFLELTANDWCVDIGCGTGNYTVSLANLGLKMIGVDQSETMIQLATRKNSRISWHLASAEDLPLPNNCVHGALCTLAIHHFTDLKRSFREVFRVLQSGRYVIFTCTPEQLRTYWLMRYFPTLINKIIDYMPTLESVVFNLQEVGFRLTAIEAYQVTDNLEDNFLYSKKTTPSAYLDPAFRSGMSIFAAKADNAEVELGCSRLRNDIQSQKIRDVIAAHGSPLGDYMFVVAEKSG